ncbi:alkyl hydroperoxide reductase subunit F [Hydrogenispora ethanolica]|uniref:Alkyl hydroperoxide reductase subunit F n=1 Tax=Hydrogenispora ethanolica TaxID=1082276 RepID=A0A4R1RME8_HYDET|nr:FAD-dependent oxidoreductase [Hydrogenispora ethanolica]TCL67364.1 alkyl hydroperoxide reductase subunit F [Hydrogenispora ethanolica]
MDYDLIIVGAGPAGMTAGVFAARKGLKTAIVTKDVGGQVNWTTDIENYMGFQEIDGQALMEKFEIQVKELQLEEKLTPVQGIQRDGEGFRVRTEAGEELRGRAVLVCSGKRPRTLNVPGEVEFRNKGVSYCSTCDGPLFKNKPVAVVGGGNSAAKSALDLANYATEIHLISMTPLTADAILVERLNGNPKVKQHIEHTVTEIRGGPTVNRVLVEAVRSKERFEIPVQGVFIEIGLEPNVDFLGDLVERNEAGEVKIDCCCRTNVAGLYAAGDVSSVPEKQIIVAAGEGAKAAIIAWEDLLHAREPALVH